MKEISALLLLAICSGFVGFNIGRETKEPPQFMIIDSIPRGSCSHPGDIALVKGRDNLGQFGVVAYACSESKVWGPK